MVRISGVRKLVKIEGMDELLSDLDTLILLASADTMKELLFDVAQEVFVPLAKENIEEQGLVDTGELKEGIMALIDTRGGVLFTSTVDYAAIHEFGGETHPTVTEKMRAWAWATYYETGDPMYKAIALTRKETLNVVIPARPYMRPAVDEGQSDAKEMIERRLKDEIRLLT